MFLRILDLFFPPKCILCKRLLSQEETDICHHCHQTVPKIEKPKLKFSFVAGWTALWYYKGNARSSLLRFKFRRKRCYAPAYGRILAMHLRQKDFDRYEVLTYVPVSAWRKFCRRYDQVELIAQATATELGVPLVPTLRKIRNTPPQSGFKDVSHRRAHVLGAYKIKDPALVRGKQILLLDDVITTGATVSECARVLLTAGAKEVYCAAMAAANPDNKHDKNK